MGARTASALLVLAVFGTTAIACADDKGTVTADARVLLAHRARLANVDPKAVVISTVTVNGDRAVVVWSAGKESGTLRLAREGARWWAIADEGAAAPASDPHVNPAGGSQHPARAQTAGYDLTLRYAQNDAVQPARFSQIYARAPTPAEFLPYPTPYRFVSDAVMFFDITIDAPRPVAFARGTTLDVWFPFALDDKLKYSISFSGGQESIGPVSGTVFDNVAHFELPGFTALPGRPLMGEIDGDVH